MLRKVYNTDPVLSVNFFFGSSIFDLPKSITFNGVLNPSPSNTIFSGLRSLYVSGQKIASRE